MKFIQISDLHLVAPGARLFELDPAERLHACIADINRHHADAELAVVTGDLADQGEGSAYRHLDQLLSHLEIPYRLLIGNHDDRGRFQASFPQAPCDENGFVQSAFDTSAGRFICLDTNEHGHSHGVLCERRLAWLAHELDAANGRPVYLFMHHPPFKVGLKRMDTISLRDSDRFADVVAGRSNIRHLFFGHLHRSLSGSWNGLPFSNLPGTNHQVALDFVIADMVPGSHEPPAYAVVFLEPELTLVHLRNFTDTTATFNL